MTEGETSNRYGQGFLENIILNVCTLLFIALCAEFSWLKQLVRVNTGYLLLGLCLLSLCSYICSEV